MTVYLALRLETTINVAGTEIKPEKPDHLAGVVLAFDDYDAALAWVDGDKSAVVKGEA